MFSKWNRKPGVKKKRISPVCMVVQKLIQNVQRPKCKNRNPAFVIRNRQCPARYTIRRTFYNYKIQKILLRQQSPKWRRSSQNGRTIKPIIYMAKITTWIKKDPQCKVMETSEPITNGVLNWAFSSRDINVTKK